ncbi:MAG: hypothetical protein P8L91_02035, partial [Candidatus Marinimicrobia bacterium]|nr:hypothetical protein [Candidatus Neomarinimicrobiota bacterium]
MINTIPYFKNLSLGKRSQWFGVILTLPALIAIFATIFYPLFVGIFNSFMDIKLMNLKDDSLNWNGFNNYIKLFNDRYFWNALKNTVFFTTIWTFGAAFIGLIAAILLNKETKIN